MPAARVLIFTPKLSTGPGAQCWVGRRACFLERFFCPHTHKRTHTHPTLAPPPGEPFSHHHPCFVPGRWNGLSDTWVAYATWTKVVKVGYTVDTRAPFWVHVLPHGL